MPNKKRSVIIKNPKKTVLRLTFYMHKNVYAHLIILLLLNTWITMGIFGIFNTLDNQIIDATLFGVLMLTTILTVTEHAIKTIMPLKMYAALTKTFGFGTVLIVFMTVSISSMMIPQMNILLVEPLMLYALVLVFVRFYMRGALLRAMRRKVRKS